MPYDPREFFDAGFADFLRRESDHIISGVSERNLCARLMFYLEATKGCFGFGHYQLDTDYNRMNGQDVKYMLGNGGGHIKIECDLLVHRRGVADNLIAMEMKKSRTMRREKEDDRTRLRILTLPTQRARHGVVPLGDALRPEDVSGYELGLFLILKKDWRLFRVEEYRRGAQVGELETVRF